MPCVDVVRRVRETVETHDLLHAGQIVVVAVSGGPDSLCLLHVLMALRAEALPGLALHVAHLNHELRGVDSQADAEYVAGLARRWGLPATVETQDVHHLRAERRLSLEEAARQARYEFLASVAGRVGAQSVAVAHNADDQAETVLMHLLRGSGLAGLRGMQPKSPFPAATASSVTLIRPLLEVTRGEIQAYCAEHGLEPRFDRSNLDTTFFRNRLRHDVLPRLEAVSHGLRERLRRMAEVMAGDYAALQQVLDSARALAVIAETPNAITFDLAAFRSLPLGLQRALVRQSVARLRAGLRDIAFAPVEAAVRLARDGEAGARASLPGGLSLRLGYDSALLAHEDYSEELPDIPLLEPGAVITVQIPGLSRLPGTAWVLRAETGRWPAEEIAANDDPWQAFVRWNDLGGWLLRARRTGDRFQPQGMGGAEPKLSDFMIAQKVPRKWRDRLPLLVQGQEIAWACGWRVSEAFAVAPDSPTVLRLGFVRRGDA
jgi:tRNA(Ile)-lysidine synthase